MESAGVRFSKKGVKMAIDKKKGLPLSFQWRAMQQCVAWRFCHFIFLFFVVVDVVGVVFVVVLLNKESRPSAMLFGIRRDVHYKVASSCLTRFGRGFCIGLVALVFRNVYFINFNTLFILI